MGNLFIMQCNIILIILGLGVNYSQCMWPPSYKIDLKDKQNFVISSDEDYDENENEMIQPEHLAGIESLVEDEAKYDPLHYHVENYNRRAAEEAEKFFQRFSFHPVMESDFKEEPKPFIAGFKHKLDKYDFEKLENADHFIKKRSSSEEDTTLKSSFKKLFSATPANKNPGYVNNNHKRIKRSDEEDTFKSNDSSMDFFEGFSNENSTTEETTEEPNEEETIDSIQNLFTEVETTKKYIKIGTTLPEIVEYLEEETTLPEDKEETDSNQFLERTTSEAETSEDYDYYKLKSEYDQQIQELQKKNETFNYTDQEEAEEETLKDAAKKIIDFKMPRNCTKEELSQIGVKAFECLIFDYKHAKNKTDVKKVFSRTWMIIRVWVFIYVGIAIPCWCQKGWCCCCFCCEICFPKEIIQAEKKYFAENPPGILIKRTKVDGKMKIETEEYKPTLFEYDAYEQMESEIRNI